MTKEEFDIEFAKIDIVEGISVGYNCEQLDNLLDTYLSDLYKNIAALIATNNQLIIERSNITKVHADNMHQLEDMLSDRTYEYLELCKVIEKSNFCKGDK